MLRGYHPFQEIYRWDRVLIALWIFYTTITGFADSAAFPTFPQWNGMDFFVTPVCMVLVWLCFISWLKRDLNKILRARRVVLNGEHRPVLPIYEICDGENTITWHANPRQKTRQPSSLSAEKYAQLLGNYVPALISQKTGLPLLDLREPKR